MIWTMVVFDIDGNHVETVTSPPFIPRDGESYQDYNGQQYRVIGENTVYNPRVNEVALSVRPL